MFMQYDHLGSLLLLSSFLPFVVAANLCSNMSMYMHICICICAYLYMYMYICMCICTSACIYTHTYAKSKCICVYTCSICTLVEYYGENTKGKP